MKFSVDTIRGLVRPTVTWGIVGSFIAAAFFDSAAAETLKDPFILVLTFWFVERAISKVRS